MAEPIAEGIVALGRRVAAAGLVVAAGGNVSARRPGDDGILVTPRGWGLDELEPSALIAVRLDGPPGPSSKTATTATTELALHLAAFRARPDATVCVHLHPPVATLLHAVGHPIRRVTTDHAYYLRRLAEVGFLHPGSDELADAVADELRHADVVLLRHHGCVIVADTFELAFSRAANLEAAAEATHRALQIGGPVPECPPEHLAHVEGLEARGVVYGKAVDAVDAVNAVEAVDASEGS